MNKALLLMLAASLAALFFISCFDSDDDEDLPGNNLTGGNDSSSSDGSSGSSSSAGVVYGDSVDYIGETYRTVVIGDQTWFARNLNYDVEGSRCHGDDPANCDIYGRLYDWENAKKVCPSGWHLPSKDEWMEFIRFVEDDVGAEHNTQNPYLSDSAGMYLATVEEWKRFSDKYGFSAMLGAGCFINGRFCGGLAVWWSVSEENVSNADCWAMIANSVMSFQEGCGKSDLLSVRCLKD